MNTKKYKKTKQLENEFKEILTSGISIEQQNQRVKRGVEILSKLIDDDVLCRLFELGETQKNL
jgi:hypothetical protein